MNYENLFKLLIGLFLLNCILITFFLKNINLTFIAILFSMGVIVLIETYFRIQHNIDRKFYVLKNSFVKDLDQIKSKLGVLEYFLKESGTINIKNEKRINDIKIIQKDIIKLFFQNKIKISSTEDITIIMGVRNRYDHRIINSLKSIRNQNYPQRLIKIMVVDYGSRADLADKYKLICKKFKAEYFRISEAPFWNRSKCLNTGLKNARTKYILFSDVDIIFEKNYIFEAIKKIKENNYRVIYSKMNFLQDDKFSIELDLKEYKSILEKTKKGEASNYLDSQHWQGMSILFGLRDLFLFIHGYDENFLLWGCEDDDLIQRLENSGVDIFDISESTSHVHQWHPKYEGVDKETNLKDQIKKNRSYMNENRSIFRN